MWFARVNLDDHQHTCLLWPQILVLTVVDTIQGALGFLQVKKTSKKKIFIWWKRARHELLYDVFHFFMALVIIEISSYVYISVGSDSSETHTLTNNGKLFNEWITWKWKKQ